MLVVPNLFTFNLFVMLFNDLRIIHLFFLNYFNFDLLPLVYVYSKTRMLIWMGAKFTA